MTRDEALEILQEYVENENLRKHAYAVEAAMRAYARKFGEDEDYWGNVGLLHDFDWEIHPTMEEHPSKGAEILRERGVDEELVMDIQAHAPHSGVPRDTLVRKAIFAVDELTGFIVACSLVRPNGISDLKASSVTKKMKDKSFAAAVDRDDLRTGAEELGEDLTDHINFVVDAMRGINDVLGL
ncbi:MAG: HDIG domain-containing protein [Armatimonadota bacterium]|nr:HDIG domain-containing protein [Armatimonadota bacterium]